jgi:hypothetical protein
MPKLPTNLAKAHAAAEKSRQLKAARAAAAAEELERDKAALEELRQRTAEHFGCDPEKITITFACRRGRRA